MSYYLVRRGVLGLGDEAPAPEPQNDPRYCLLTYGAGAYFDQDLGTCVTGDSGASCPDGKWDQDMDADGNPIGPRTCSGGAATPTPSGGGGGGGGGGGASASAAPPAAPAASPSPKLSAFGIGALVVVGVVVVGALVLS